MKKIGLVVFLVTMALSLHAQQGGRNDRIESLKVAFITQKLDLSPAESADFWPLYNEMEDKIADIKKRPVRRAMQVESDEEAKEFIQERFQNEELALSIKKEYYLKLVDEIGARKVMRLNQVESQFKRELLKEVRNRRGGAKSR